MVSKNLIKSKYENLLKINIFTKYANYMSKKAINRLKVVLVENNVSSKWLAERLNMNEATISRWCTNNAQPPLKTLLKISEILNVRMSDLLLENIE